MLDYVEFASVDSQPMRAFFEAALGWSFEWFGPDDIAFHGVGLEGGIYRATIDLSSSTSAGQAAKEAKFEKVFDKPVYAVSTHGGITLAALPFTSDDSVVRSDDGGVTWTPFATGID